MYRTVRQSVKLLISHINMIEGLLNRINVFVMSVVPLPITGNCDETTPLQQCKD